MFSNCLYDLHSTYQLVAASKRNTNRDGLPVVNMAE